MNAFRNLTLFRFSTAVAEDLLLLEAFLAEHRLRPCGPMEMFTAGFVPPVGRNANDPLTQASGNFVKFTAAGEDKMLPSSVIKDEVHRRVQKIAEEECRKVGGRERKRIKEDVLNDLLPKAFVRGWRVSGYADLKNGWLVLDTASRKRAERIVTMLREALGSFPAVPLAPEEGPRVLMTDWLARSEPPAGLELCDEVELRDPATSQGAIAKCRRQELTAEEVLEHLRNGKQVFQLGLVFDDRMSFVLGEDLVVRKLKFLDAVLDQMADSFVDHFEEAQASLAVLTLELERLLAKLEEWFGLPRPVAQ